MHWLEKIKAGMALIKEGCNQNTDWTKCPLCPFYEFCVLIEEDSKQTPDEAFFPWEED